MSPAPTAFAALRLQAQTARTQFRAFLTAHDRDYWWGLAWCVGNGVAIILDLWLVFTGHTSISMGTWVQTNLHPTLIDAGVLAGLGVARLVRRYWWMVVFTCIMTGHLFAHW